MDRNIICPKWIRPPNRLSNGNAGSAGMYDANGNMTGAPGAILTYDVSNHVASANVNGAVEQYGYTLSNQRFYKRKSDGTEYITFYGAMGERLAEYKFGRSYLLPIYFKSYVWFRGRLICEGPTTLYGQSGTSALMDRVGSNRAIGAKFMP